MVTLGARIRALFAAPVEEAKPKIAVSGGEGKTPFGKVERNPSTLRMYQNIYESGGPVAEAIEVYALTALSNGYRLEGDPAEVEMVQSVLDTFDFETVLHDGIVQALVTGDGFQEVVRSRSRAFHSVQLRSSARFKVEIDPGTGLVRRYVYMPDDDTATGKGTPLEPRDVVHLVLNPKPGSPYGRSLIGRAMDDIMRDAATSEGIAAAVKRHGYPKYHIVVGKSGEAVPKKTIDSVERTFRELDSKNDFATGPDIEIRNIDTTGLPGAEMFATISTQRLCAAMGVPEEMLGLGRGSTEATANVRLRVFYDKVSAIQRRVARTYTLQVIDQITREPGRVRLEFNDPNPFDEAATAEWIAKIMGANPLDPFAVLPLEWIQKKFGIDPTEAAPVAPSAIDEEAPA